MFFEGVEHGSAAARDAGPDTASTAKNAKVALCTKGSLPLAGKFNMKVSYSKRWERSNESPS